MDDTNDANGLIEQKVTDLTESLYRTTDVLSTADRMIDHYRDLNREQEHEIARVNTRFWFHHNIGTYRLI